MVTVIIPAHNEAASIASCLFSLSGSDNKQEFETIVVCNGCVDNTAEIAKQNSFDVICLETDIPSKTSAINLGELHSKFFPRIYLDADVMLTRDAIFAMCSTLESGALATSVEPQMDLSSSSWFVKAFYEIWLSLPYCKAGMIGSGVYALSEEGRSRFDRFPNIIADDGYVRALFTESERSVTKGHYAIVTAPKDLLSLIKIKTRSRLGRYQLKDKFSELLANEAKDFQGAFKSLCFDVKLWPKLLVYVGVNLISRIRARHQYITKQTKWERDESSRA